jgi:hypothetical protein
MTVTQGPSELGDRRRTSERRHRDGARRLRRSGCGYLRPGCHWLLSGQVRSGQVRSGDTSGQVNHSIGIAGLVGLFLDSGLHFTDDAEAPLAVARDVDAALLVLVTAQGRWATTPSPARGLDAGRAAGASRLAMLCHSPLLEASRRLSPSSPSSLCTAKS